MNESEMGQLIDALSKLIAPQLCKSEPLRRAVGIIGTWLAEEARRAEQLSTTENPNTPSVQIAATISEQRLEDSGTQSDEAALPSPVMVMTSPVTPVQPLPVTTARVPLKLGDEVLHLPVSGTTNEIGLARLSAQTVDVAASTASGPAHDDGTIDLSRIVARCRLKAAACRLQAQRLVASTSDAPDLLDEMNELIAKARAMVGCYLWVFNRSRPCSDSSALLLIAENYDAMADTVEAVRKCDETLRSQDAVDALNLLAEAASSLRAAMVGAWNREDRDQTDTHQWLKYQTALRQVFIERYMTEGDAADPRKAADVSRRAHALVVRLNGKLNHSRTITRALNKIKFHAKKIAREQGSNATSEWPKIEEALKELAAVGVSPADRRVGDAIGPAIKIPFLESHTPPASVGAALAAAMPSTNTVKADCDVQNLSEQVLEVRSILSGKRAVLIGGEARERTREALQAAFDLADLDWVELSEHGSSSLARPAIIRHDTALVMVLARLAGHQHVEDARGYAKSAGKPFVLLPAGFSADAISAAVLDQASQRLRVNTRV